MKLTKKDKTNIVNAYLTKYNEYKALSLDELKQLYETKKIRGSYLKALLDVVTDKLREESLKQQETNENNENTLPNT